MEPKRKKEIYGSTPFREISRMVSIVIYGQRWSNGSMPEKCHPKKSRVRAKKKSPPLSLNSIKRSAKAKRPAWLPVHPLPTIGSVVKNIKIPFTTFWVYATTPQNRANSMPTLSGMALNGLDPNLRFPPPMLKDTTRRLRQFCPVPSPLKALHLKSFARPQRISVTGVRTSTRKPSKDLELRGLFVPSFFPAGCSRHSDIIGLVEPAPSIAGSTGQECR